MLRTLDDVLAMDGRAKDYLTTHSDDFIGLNIREFSCGEYFESTNERYEFFRCSDSDFDFDAIVAAPRAPEHSLGNPNHVSYQFHPSVLRMPVIRNRWVFTVEKPDFGDLTILERFFFRDREFASYEFKLPATESWLEGDAHVWDQTYRRSAKLDELEADMIANPWETRSDTFVFCDRRLIKHAKASYSYKSKVSSGEQN